MSNGIARPRVYVTLPLGLTISLLPVHWFLHSLLTNGPITDVSILRSQLRQVPQGGPDINFYLSKSHSLGI